MSLVSLFSNILTTLLFGGLFLFFVFFSSASFWSSFKESSLLGTNPTPVDRRVARGITLALRLFPWTVLLGIVGAWLLYFLDRHLIALLLGWLPGIVLLTIPVLLAWKIRASRRGKDGSFPK